MAVISRHNRTCCFEFPTPFPATFPSCHLLGSRHAQVERLRNEWARVHTAICELPWSWAFLRWGGYFRVRGAAGGLALNHGSERHLTSCWALMLPLDEPRTLPGNSGPVDWSKGTQAYCWAGLPLSWAGLPSPGLVSSSVVRTWDHSKNTAELWCWFMWTLHWPWRVSESSACHGTSSKTGNKRRCSQRPYTQGNLITSVTD